MSDGAHDLRFDEAPDVDRLLARAVAGDASAIAEIRSRGAHDPALLEELALWQADELRLSRAARALDSVADRAELAAPASPRASRLGWLVAACLAVVLSAQQFLAARDGRPAAPQANTAGLAGSFGSAEDAFAAYVERARQEGLVEGEVAPPTLVRSRELGDGRGFEVLILRQVVERRVTPEVYRVAPMGESGRPRTIVIRPRTDAVQ